MNSYLFKEKIAAQVGFEPQHTAYEAEALPTELLRQSSWLGQIKLVNFIILCACHYEKITDYS